MANIIETILDSVDIFLAWASSALKQTTESYCELQTADSPTVLVNNDGSLASILRIQGVKALIGSQEFETIQNGLLRSLQASMSRSGHSMQVYFNYDKTGIQEEIIEIFKSAQETAKRLNLSLGDLFSERVEYLARYCANEEVCVVLWTRPSALTGEQYKHAMQDKQKTIKRLKIPPFRFTQNIIAAISDLRNEHDSFVRSVTNDFNALGIVANLLNVHEALYFVRSSVDADFTDRTWRPVLPGDKITIKELKTQAGNIADVLWPSLAKQLLPRDAENIDLRTARVGDRVYSCIFIDLFPKELQRFIDLLARTLPTQIPWRISFLIEGNGLASLKVKNALTSVLSWTSAQNRLLNDAINLLYR